MGKSRSEIQKAYRERQKAKGAAFLEKERTRQTQYYVPTLQLSAKKREARNHKNKLRNRLSRLKKRQRRESNDKVVEETSGYDSLANENDHDEEQIEQPGPNSPDQLGPSSPFHNKLIVKLPNRAKNIKKVNARALSRANRTISTLTAEIGSLKRKMRTKSKQIERLSKKMKVNKTSKEQVTPKKKTAAEVEALRLTPRREKIVRKKLLTCNVLMQEIHESKVASGKKKVNSIHKVISGGHAKKNRCLKSISRSVHVCRRALAKTDTKQCSIRKEQRHSLSKVVANSVTDFMNREDNSRTQPGKADAKRTEGQKEKVQTKVLTDYLKNLHDKYTAECPDNKISLSTFARLRPTNVLLASFISRNTCQCIHHQNMALKVQSLRKAGLRISENPENLFMHRDDLDQLLSNLPEKVAFRVWQKVDIGNGKLKMQIVEKEDERDKFKEDLIKQLQLFEQHVQRVREQYQQVRKLKENLPEDEVMVQMDFAENYSCRSLNEPQPAYWNLTMVTLHPVVAYYKDNGELKHKSYVVVSDELTHSSSTVCAFLDKIMPELKTLKPELKCVHYWTDSPSSQYRNRYIFHVVANHDTLYGMSARWNYFEVGHGKGPCDGLGGTAKRMADMAIRQGHTQIQNAEEFYKWGSNSSLTAKFLFVGSEITKHKQEELHSVLTKPLKGTMKLHAVGQCESTGAFMTKDTSCYCQDCLMGGFCKSWKREHLKCAVVNNANLTDTSCVSRHDCQSESSAVSSMPNADIDKQKGSMNCHSVSGADPPRPAQDTGSSGEGNVNADRNTQDSSMNFDVGSVVAVVYDEAWYVGEIRGRDDQDGEYEVKFMEKAKEMYRWPRYEDRLWVQKEAIICLLTSLKPSGKSSRLFKLDSEEKHVVEELYRSRY